MRGLAAIWLLGCAVAGAQQAPIPSVGELSGHPFAIKNTWVIGGVGNWDYLTLDPAARQLFIAHGPTVQVVDVGAGTIAGTVKGFREAHAIALDQAGEFGYATDGPAGLVRIFDRRSFEVVGTVAVGGFPRALALEPQTGLLFVVINSLVSATQQQPPTNLDRSRASRESPPPNLSPDDAPCGVDWDSKRRPVARPESLVSVIETEKRREIAQLRLCGVLGFAQADGVGGVFINLTSQNETARADAAAILQQAQDQGGLRGQDGGPVDLDWRSDAHAARPNPRSGSRPRSFAPVGLRIFRLGNDCKSPRGVAVDGPHSRLFVACGNMKMTVLNTDTGEVVQSLTIGPGADAVAYDAGRGLIFTANGGGYGSVSVIRQHVTDSFAVIQNLPTMQQARTMAVDPSTGLVYLVTTLYGARLDHPPLNGIGTLKTNPVDGSFQVLVIGQ
jgi:DNA-binding beta-propeller fold protein YncE